MKLFAAIFATILAAPFVLASEEEAPAPSDDAAVQCQYQIDFDREKYVDEAGFKQACMDFYRNDPNGKVAAGYGACMLEAKEKAAQKVGPDGKLNRSAFGDRPRNCVEEAGGPVELKAAIKASKKAWKEAGLDAWEKTPR